MASTHTAEVHLFRCLETRFGRFYWDTSKLGLATAAGAFGAVVGLFAGAYVGLPLGNGLGSALLSLATSALCALILAVNTLRA